MPPNSITNIAIVGATGTVGAHITSALLATGRHNITALTRSASSTPMPPGVIIHRVDYTSHSDLTTALQNQDALIITLGVAASADNTQRNLICAAAAAGVKWIMPNEYSPDFGAQKDLGDDAFLGPGIRAIREYIESLGVSSWSGLACSYWYQHCLISPMAYGFDIANKNVTFFDNWETKVKHSTLEQCGRAVAGLFSLPVEQVEDGKPYLNQWRNKECYCSSFTISQREILDSILRVTGDSEEDWTISKEASYERWKDARAKWDAGNPTERFVAMVTRVFFPDGSGDFKKKLDDKVLCLPEENLDEATREAVEMVRTGKKSREFAGVRKQA